MSRWFLLVLVSFAVALALSACGEDPDAPQTREVLVDYTHDEFASSFLLYFPRDVTVRPGDRLRFRQEWTGEPHSVTMGTLVDDVMREAMPIVERYRGTPLDRIPPDDITTVEGLFEQLPPFMLDEPGEGSGVNQNVAQPCFLDEGGPPADLATPCSDEQQVQPPFNGRQSFYNSGFIPYQGPQGNEFEVALADDIAPGTYYYYCNVHGPLQYGTINVVEPGTAIPSQAEVSAQARREIEEAARPLKEAYEEAQARDAVEVHGITVEKPLSGFAVDDEWTHAFISEFIPRELQVEAGQKVSWSFVGLHTVSFNVPEYFSQMTVEDDGTVVFNPQAVLPVNGPGYPEEPEDQEGDAPPEGGPERTTEEVPPGEPGEGEEERPPPPAVDAGRWDGREFLSSGVFTDGTYSVTFTTPGTYRYACLIHPQMVGTVTVG
ncbi:MAG TPA: hypothetical protein VHF25_15970 [Nitriliruptorales bacterium]|nr:hypothetical protein [Nitriliruptorales bacterium]